VTKLSRLDACEDRKVVRWCRPQAPIYGLQGGVYARINEACVSTAASDRSAVQCFADEKTRAKVPFRNVVAPAHQLGPVSRLKSAKRDVNFVRSDPRCR